MATSSVQGSVAGGLEGPDQLFVSGIPYYFKEEQIREFLEYFGPLRSFKLVTDSSTGTGEKAACFAYQDVSVTDNACTTLNGIQMGSRTLIVRRANHGTANEQPQPCSVPPQVSSIVPPQESCGICCHSLIIGEGRAIFIAECSHCFHYPCIANNVKYGNLNCPVCTAKWDKNNVPFQVPPPKMLQQLEEWYYPENPFLPPQQDPPEPLTYADDEPLQPSSSPP